MYLFGIEDLIITGVVIYFIDNNPYLLTLIKNLTSIYQQMF